MTQKKLDSLISFVFWLQNVFKFLSVFFFFCTGSSRSGAHCLNLAATAHSRADCTEEVDALITRWGKIDHSLQLIPFITSCQRLRQASHRQHGGSSSQRLHGWVKPRLTDTNLHQRRAFRFFFYYYYGCSLFLRLKYIFPIKLP